MAINEYARATSTKKTPQGQPIPGEPQVKNDAGGYVYALDKWAMLDRFLVLGAAGGTYYVSERQHMVRNADAVRACLAEDGSRVVRRIVEISDAGRAPTNDPAVVALALAVASTDVATRMAAYDALPKVCRIPTHLFQFLEVAKGLRGWGRGLRRAVSRWYNEKPVDQLAYQMVKYQQREKWSHRDALRLSHPKTTEPMREALYRWATTRDGTLDARAVTRRLRDGERIDRYGAVAGDMPPIVRAMGEAHAEGMDTIRLVSLIQDYNLTREMVPTGSLTKAAVWAALLQRMPMTAMLRNLGNMTKAGLVAPLSDATRAIVARLRDESRLRTARVHPLAVLVALRTYAGGHGIRGSSEWTPVQAVVDALDDAFYLAFGAVEPANVPMLLALDVSGSMGSSLGALPISCREAAGALALVTANTEPQHAIVGFTGASGRGKWSMRNPAVEELAISPKQRLDDVVRYLESLGFGTTDCALPALYAKEHNLGVDGIAIYTDNETWAGDVHPSQALRDYRQASGRATRQAVVGMTSTGFTIASQDDPLSLDVVGFDTATPQAIAEFVRGEV